jgi:hypothetical protein
LCLTQSSKHKQDLLEEHLTTKKLKKKREKSKEHAGLNSLGMHSFLFSFLSFSPFLLVFFPFFAAGEARPNAVDMYVGSETGKSRSCKERLPDVCQ